MGSASENVLLNAPANEVWDFYFDPTRWRGWVDGFAEVFRISDDYPAGGSRLVWDSRPGGRGRVVEEVLLHDPRSLHRIRFEDETAVGHMETTFDAGEGSCAVAVTMEYAVKQAGPFNVVTDLLFIRRSVAQSIGRTLDRLKRDVEGDRELLGPAGLR